MSLKPEIGPHGDRPEGGSVKYSHMFAIAFTVETENDAESVTADELRDGLADRIRGLRHGDEILEACGLPDDTYVID